MWKIYEQQENNGEWKETPKDVAMDLGISVPTLYRWLPAAQRT